MVVTQEMLVNYDHIRVEKKLYYIVFARACASRGYAIVAGIHLHILLSESEVALSM